MKKKLLLTSFEPFNGQTINPSREVARAMKKQRFAGAELEVLELPVHRFDAIESTLNHMRIHKPDLVIMLGEAGGRSGLTPEKLAVNLDDFPIPDNGGHQPRGEKISESGLETYRSTLPIVEIEKRLIAAQIPVSLSYSAGTYLCNRLFYCVMQHISNQPVRSSAGFIHVPYLAEQVSHLATEIPSFSRETLIEAVQLSIEVCLAYHGQQVEPF